MVLDILERQGRYEVAFLVDENPSLKDQEVYGYCVIGGEEDLGAYGNRPGLAIVAVGDSKARGAIAQRLQAAGVELVTAIHPGAQIARGATIGEGTVVMAGCVINSDARLGSNVIINTCASVDHDCVIGNNVHIAPGCRLCGHVHVGDGAFVGAGCIVMPSKRIGQHSVVGACSGVIDDVPDGTRVAGTPARPI